MVYYDYSNCDDDNDYYCIPLKGERFLILVMTNSASLRIESGRFTIPKTHEDLRICDHCSLNSVENEMHVLCQCDLYDVLRKILFSKMNEISYLQITITVINYVFFLTILIHISRLTTSFIFQAFERRKKLNHIKLYHSITFFCTSFFTILNSHS